MRQLERHIETLSLGRREERKERREGGREKGREDPGGHVVPFLSSQGLEQQTGRLGRK